jgi:hypothetical protein
VDRRRCRKEEKKESECMKNLFILISLLIATPVTAQPTFPTGRYVGTMILTRDDLGCGSSGSCPLTLPMNFRITQRGNSALLVGANGNRAILYRKPAGNYVGLLKSVLVNGCQLNIFGGVSASRGRYIAEELDQFVCENGTYYLRYLGYPRKVS